MHAHSAFSPRERRHPCRPVLDDLILSASMPAVAPARAPMLSMKRSTLRQVLECGSPVPLSIWPCRRSRSGASAADSPFQKRHRTAALQNAAAQIGAWSQCMRKRGKGLHTMAVLALLLQSAPAQQTSRSYENHLAPITHPTPLLADHPEWAEP